MKIRYLILLAAILFVIGCAQQPATTPTETPTETTPTETPTETTPTETTPTVTGDVVIQDRTVTPTELTVSAGTEVSISIKGKTAHILLIDKGVMIEANLGTFKDGDVTSYVFEEAGSYRIRSMKVGSVRVAVTVE